MPRRQGQSAFARLVQDIVGDILSYLDGESLLVAEGTSKLWGGLIASRDLWHALYCSTAKHKRWTYPPLFIPTPGTRPAVRSVLDADCPQSCRCRKCWVARCDSWKHAFFLYRSELNLREIRSLHPNSKTFVVRIEDAKRFKESGSLPYHTREFVVGKVEGIPLRWAMSLVKHSAHVFVWLSMHTLQVKTHAFFVIHLLGTTYTRITSHHFVNTNHWYHRCPVSCLTDDLVLQIDLTAIPGGDGAVQPLQQSSRRVVGSTGVSVVCDKVVYRAADMLRLTKKSHGSPPTEFKAGRGKDGSMYVWSLSFLPATYTGEQLETWVVLTQCEQVCAFLLMRVVDDQGRALSERCFLHDFQGRDHSASKRGCRFLADLFKNCSNQLEITVATFDSDMESVHFAFDLAYSRLTSSPQPLSPPSTPRSSSFGNSTATGTPPSSPDWTCCVPSLDDHPSWGRVEALSDSRGPPRSTPDVVFECVQSLGFFVADRRMEQAVQMHASNDIVRMFCNSDTPPRLRSAASSTIWNLLDSTPITIGLDHVEAMTRVIDTHMGHLLAFARDPTDTSNPYHSVNMERGREGDDQSLRRYLLRSMTGILSNLSVQHDCRMVMLNQPGLLGKVLETVEYEEYCDARFSCYNMLSMVHLHGLLEQRYIAPYTEHLTSFCTADRNSKFNMRISLRDVTDFFIPLVTSRRLECITFGAWCMNLMYFKDRWQGDRTTI